jgi:hypothetical protein
MDMPATVEKGNIKLTEYTNESQGYEDRFFIQCTCVGFYMTKEELKDLYTVVSYYLNADDYSDINIYIGGEHVAS